MLISENRRCNDNLPVTCSHLQFCKVNRSVKFVAQIVTLCKDSLHADWTLIITGIDVYIEYTVVVDNMQGDQKY